MKINSIPRLRKQFRKRLVILALLILANTIVILFQL